MGYEFYTEPFDVNKPPPAPPNRDMDYRWLFIPIGFTETKASKRRQAEYSM